MLHPTNLFLEITEKLFLEITEKLKQIELKKNGYIAKLEIYSDGGISLMMDNNQHTCKCGQGCHHDVYEVDYDNLNEFLKSDEE